MVQHGRFARESDRTGTYNFRTTTIGANQSWILSRGYGITKVSPWVIPRVSKVARGLEVPEEAQSDSHCFPCFAAANMCIG